MKIQAEKKTIFEKINKILIWNSFAKVLWRIVPDKIYVKLLYFRTNKKLLSFKNPQGYDQKMACSKVINRDPETTKSVCKYEVREIVRKKVGEKYLNELYGVYNNVEDIDFNNLPNQFVLKGTHGSQMNIICKDKNTLNIEKAKKQLKKWLNTNYYWVGREWQYKNTEPRIICEKYLEQDDGSDLMDYRFFCFNGEPEILAIDIDKYGEYKRNLYDMEFNLLDVKLGYPQDKNINIQKPNKFEEMVEIARELSREFNHVRVDLYTCNNEIYFGELTFFHAGGGQKFSPSHVNDKLGDLIKL